LAHRIGKEMARAKHVLSDAEGHASNNRSPKSEIRNKLK